MIYFQISQIYFCLFLFCSKIVLSHSPSFCPFFLHTHLSPSVFPPHSLFQESKDSITKSIIETCFHLKGKFYHTRMTRSISSLSATFCFHFCFRQTFFSFLNLCEDCYTFTLRYLSQSSLCLQEVNNSTDVSRSATVCWVMSWST